MKVLFLVLVAAVVFAAPAGAQEPTLDLEADTKRKGLVGLTVTGPAGSELGIAEDTKGDRLIAKITLPQSGTARIRKAATWSCDMRRRSFYAQGQSPLGLPLYARTQITTPGCENRFRLKAKKRPRATKPLKVRVKDTFKLDAAPHKVCARGPARLRACARVRTNKVKVRIPRPGRWHLTAKRAKPLRLKVRRAPGPVSILATGDSMIQIIDSYLAQRLTQRVKSDAHISTGLSKPFYFNWPAHARRQVRSKPDVVVMFIGANDGFSFGDVACCGKDWQRKYANVASGMMRTYLRDGAASVYWCLLPAPRPSNFRRVYGPVNSAIRRAAKRNPLVQVVDFPKTFTPGFRFRQTITWRGRTVSVRQDDGVHFNTAGASIAATLIIRHMRRDGVL